MTSPARILSALLSVCCLMQAGTAEDKGANYSQAEILVRQGQWDSGITILTEILEAQPGNLKARNLLGIALTEKGDLTKANQEFRQVIKADPRFYPALKNLAINELSQKDVAAAQKHLTAALALSPNDSVIHSYLGDIAYTRRDYMSAASHLEKSGKFLEEASIAARLAESYLEIGRKQRGLELLARVDQQQLAARSQFKLGLALSRNDLYQEAAPYFRAVSLQYPDSYDTAFNLAICYVQANRFNEAIETLRRIANRGHQTAELNNLLAEAYEGNHQTQEAINALREATHLAPQDENNYVDLATLCANYEAYDLGSEIIEVGLYHIPQSDRLIFQRGVIAAMRNRFDLAEKDFQLASNLAPEKNLSYVAMGISYMQMGNLPKAILSLRQRTRRKPNDAIIQYLLGEALLRSGATRGDAAFLEAKAALEKSVNLNPRFPASQIDLARIYLKEDRLDDALRHLDLARKIDPEEKTVYSQLAIVYRRKGKPELASEMLTILNKLNSKERTGGYHKRLQKIGDSVGESPK